MKNAYVSGIKVIIWRFFRATCALVIIRLLHREGQRVRRIIFSIPLGQYAPDYVYLLRSVLWTKTTEVLSWQINDITAGNRSTQTAPRTSNTKDSWQMDTITGRSPRIEPGATITYRCSGVFRISIRRGTYQIWNEEIWI